MKSFREMSPVRVAVVSLAVVGLVLGVLFNFDAFPKLLGAEVYRAAFTDVAGLEVGSQVRIGGVTVGKVQDIDLTDDSIVVDFAITSNEVGRLGQHTSAAIKTETLLGKKYLEVTPSGSGQLASDALIPQSRTTVPYDITSQLGNVSTLAGDIDKKKLASSFDAISSAFGGAPGELRPALQGLTRLSQSVSSRDSKVRDLFRGANGVSGILASRNIQLNKLFTDGGALLDELQSRKAEIHALIVNMDSVAQQVSGLVKDNKDQLGPALQHLNSVLDVLRRNEGSIASAIQKAGPVAQTLGEALASGPFWDAFISNLALTNITPLPGQYTPPDRTIAPGATGPAEPGGTK
ncbi:MCE family protein [Sciscionella marina]|uniref:MCE family protein n=1 Tax=Sciscionella marina TaxID=508770 RepID=UPI00036E494E|nr:MCE family protein [Sciscionella marina]